MHDPESRHARGRDPPEPPRDRRARRLAEAVHVHGEVEAAARDRCLRGVERHHLGVRAAAVAEVVLAEKRRQRHRIGRDHARARRPAAQTMREPPVARADVEHARRGESVGAEPGGERLDLERGVEQVAGDAPPVELEGERAERAVFAEQIEQPERAVPREVVGRRARRLPRACRAADRGIGCRRGNNTGRPGRAGADRTSPNAPRPDARGSAAPARAGADCSARSDSAAPSGSGARAATPCSASTSDGRYRPRSSGRSQRLSWSRSALRLATSRRRDTVVDRRSGAEVSGPRAARQILSPPASARAHQQRGARGEPRQLDASGSTTRSADGQSTGSATDASTYIAYVAAPLS